MHDDGTSRRSPASEKREPDNPQHAAPTEQHDALRPVAALRSDFGNLTATVDELARRVDEVESGEAFLGRQQILTVIALLIVTLSVRRLGKDIETVASSCAP